MSVDFLVCNNCGGTFCDCWEYTSCESCGKHWCSDECAEENGFRIEVDNEEEYSTSCKYCREEDFEDDVLLEYALEKLELSRKQLLEMYKSETE
jgi:hypothetical protein